MIEWNETDGRFPFERLVGQTREEAEEVGELDSWENMQYCFDFGFKLGSRKERDACADICSGHVVKAAILSRHAKEEYECKE